MSLYFCEGQRREARDKERGNWMENEVSWSKKKKTKHKRLSEWRTISEHFLCSICNLLLQCCIQLWRKSAVTSTFICCDGCFQLRHFFLLFFYVLQTTTVFKRLLKTYGSPLWMTTWGQALRFPTWPHWVTFERTLLFRTLQMHASRPFFEWVCNRYALWLSPLSGRSVCIPLLTAEQKLHT